MTAKPCAHPYDEQEECFATQCPLCLIDKIERLARENAELRSRIERLDDLCSQYKAERDSWHIEASKHLPTDAEISRRAADEKTALLALPVITNDMHEMLNGESFFEPCGASRGVPGVGWSQAAVDFACLLQERRSPETAAIPGSACAECQKHGQPYICLACAAEGTAAGRGRSRNRRQRRLRWRPCNETMARRLPRLRQWCHHTVLFREGAIWLTIRHHRPAAILRCPRSKPKVPRGIAMIAPGYSPAIRKRCGSSCNRRKISWSPC